jgi:hypothetical protein
MVVMAVALAAALGGVESLVHGLDDVGHGNLRHGLGQAIAAARTPNAGHEMVAAQFAEQLLQIGQGDSLPVGDAGKGHGAGVLPQCEIDHRRHRETSFGRQSHGLPLSLVDESGNT